MIEIKDIVEFKEAVKILQLRAESGEFNYPDNWECGLCYMLKFYCDQSYRIMDCLLDTLCLNDYGTFTEERELFLEFLAYTLSAEDIYEICVDNWED